MRSFVFAGLARGARRLALLVQGTHLLQLTLLLSVQVVQ